MLVRGYSASFNPTPKDNFVSISNYKKAIVQHALCWGAAFLAPPIVMVILDLLDRHTPATVAVFSSMVLMIIFGLSHALLSKNLAGENQTSVEASGNSQ